MTAFVFKEAIESLERTPGVLRSLLEGLPAMWLNGNEGPDTWSPRDVLAHLTDLEEQDWIPRLTTILKNGDAHPLAPVDRVRFRTTLLGKSVAELLQLFAERREQNLRQLEAWKLGPSDLDRRGLHPQRGPVTLQQLVATWVVHDQTHIAQIVRTMAHQYAGEVGPWEQYLGILQWRKAKGD